MLEDGKSIKIQHWDEADKPNGWMVIRLKFTKPIIPQEFEGNLIEALEGVFDGYL